MLAPIHHRGPDGSGIWQSGRVAFGHARLAIIDLTEAAAEPMLTADGTGVLVYNGEVYNYQELRRALQREGIQFRSSGDTEVVLQALHHWGPHRAIPQFNGMFALAYFDQRVSELWLARDRLGIKPLAVADTGDEFLFASETKALLAHTRMQPCVDNQAVTRWILGDARSPRVLFAGIESLQPGSWWKITCRGIERQQYYHVLTSVDVDRLVATSGGTPNRFVTQFSSHLRRSVKLHLASDAPLAVICSGGVDSSLIAAYTKEELPGTQGYVADVPPGGEGHQAVRVGRHLDMPIQRVFVDRNQLLRAWPDTVWHSDAPPTHASDAALLTLVRACRADGIKVLLTGEGSDELFGGYEWMYKDWSSIRSSGLGSFNPFSKTNDAREPFSSSSWMLSRISPRLRRRLTIALDTEWELLPKRCLEHLASVEPEADRAFLGYCLCSMYHHLSWILHRHDRIGMAASLEMRVPFLENEMFDFAFHLPRRAKLHRKTSKWVVKEAAAKVLPKDIVFAKKQGFPIPKSFSRGTQWLLIGGFLPELMKWPTATVNDIVASLGEDASLRFHVVSLELWGRIFFGGESPAALGETLVALAGDQSLHRRKQIVDRKGSSQKTFPAPSTA
jgi:asparagine synthase (glutamine-hydrolysing)